MLISLYNAEMHFFFYVQSPCVTRPCLNRASCVPDYQRNDYHCECNSGYSGKNCENGK